ncbi:PQQ-binding-like beta-propeller repeat protein [Streptomyces sp. NPDC048282]|uniref:outer membrane protein assembly factor BamB family protein n=1 Tax=Streptomyces sp. NPDC048282 TaxID=3365528 RepID=UPI003719FBF9
MAVFEALQPQDPRLVGRYRIVARLGAGGMGRVYLARSPGGRPVAVKVVRPELAGDADFRRRFAREVAAARRVNGAFTAGVVDADPDGSPAWLATVYVPGVSLGEAIAGHGPWPTRSVLALAAGLAEALEAIHAAGVVHRDLKPSNILLAADGPKVIDFGISVAVDASALTQTGMTIGTPGFMSPEQLTDQPVGPASDVFTLGTVLAYTATGVGPFGTGTPHALHYRAVHEPPNLAALPPELREVVAACLAKDPGQRPTIAHLLDRLAPADGTDEGGGEPAAATLPAEPGWLPEQIALLVRTHTATTLPSTPPATPASDSESAPGTPPRTTPPAAPPPPPAEQPGAAPPAPDPHRATTPTKKQHHPVPPAPEPSAPVRPPHGHPPGPPHAMSRRRALLGLTGTALATGTGLTGWKLLSGNTTDSGTKSGSLLWKFRTGDVVFSSPTVFGGLVYFGSWDNSLYAVNAATGEKRWSSDTGSGVTSSPTVASGVVYVGGGDRYLYALNATSGEKNWSFPTGNAVYSSPTVAGDLVYVGSNDHHLYAVTTLGGEKHWSFDAGNVVDSSPTVVGGIVYVGCWGGRLYAVDAATGKKRWSFDTDDDVFSSPTVAGGIVYFGSNDGNLYAVNAATGEKRWSFPTGNAVESSPTVAGGTVYVGSFSSMLYAVDATTGEERWSCSADDTVYSSPTLVGGVVYFGSWDNSLYAVDAATGKKRWSFLTGDNVSSSPTVTDGIVYFGSDDGNLYAVRT